jgi:bifunctional DNA-binding transcriptional regulator/antitoxin component of YhaV-PrlF toxin-antitoxin module
VQKSDGGEHHVELSVLDAAGRVQLPREYLEQFDIKRRVLIETTEQGILIRKPEASHHQGGQGSLMEEQVEVRDEALQGSSKLRRVWESVMSVVRKGLRR